MLHSVLISNQNLRVEKKQKSQNTISTSKFIRENSLEKAIILNFMTCMLNLVC